MIDTDKYEGVEEVYLCEELHKGWTDVISKETNQPIARIYCADTVRSHSPTPAHHILMDAFKMYREVKRLREWKAEVERICRTMNGPNRDTALFIMTNEVEE
jgi:hypothetical protein